MGAFVLWRIMQFIESNNQKKFVNWLRITHPELDGLWCAVPNGGKRDVREAVRLKQEGVRKGWPDFQLMYPNSFFSGLFLEFKAGTNKPSKDQKEVIEKLESVGYCVFVVYSYDEAREKLEKYLQLPLNVT